MKRRSDSIRRRTENERCANRVYYNINIVVSQYDDSVIPDPSGGGGRANGGKGLGDAPQNSRRHGHVSSWRAPDTTGYGLQRTSHTEKTTTTSSGEQYEATVHQVTRNDWRAQENGSAEHNARWRGTGPVWRCLPLPPSYFFLPRRRFCPYVYGFGSPVTCRRPSSDVGRLDPYRAVLPRSVTPPPPPPSRRSMS